LTRWVLVAFVAASTPALAQGPQPAPREAAEPSQASTRQAAIEQEEAAKVTNVHPPVPNKGEKIFEKLDTILQGGRLRWHPFFENAYSGGGLRLCRPRQLPGAHNTSRARQLHDLGLQAAEVEFIAPRMFTGRAAVAARRGREATQVGFYGIGTNTSNDDRTNYLFQQPYGSALFSISPTRRFLMLGGGVELSQWSQKPGQGTFPSVETVYTPATLPGLGAEITYLHTQGTIAIDTGARHPDTRAAALISARRCTIMAMGTTHSASA
jgi:hypothetical protein